MPVQQQVADVVLTACRRIAGEGNGSVTLAQVQADPEVGARVRAASRITDLMATLEREGRVRMTARYPALRWRVIEAA